MTIKRYQRTKVFGLNYRYGTSYAAPAIREGINSGSIRYRELILSESERLDIIAGKEYGDGSLYWIIAAASNIGWGLQVPPGTRIVVPNLDDVTARIG